MIDLPGRTPLFDLFWINTKLNDKNVLSWVSDFTHEQKGAKRIQYPASSCQLTYPDDELFEIMKKRRSGRHYHGRPLTHQQLSSLFASFTQVDGHRLLSSAGAKYPIEVYALCWQVQNFQQKVLYYDYTTHAISTVGDCDAWVSVKNLTSAGELISGEPSLLFVFVGFPSRVTSKYGERGGRFLLLEAGHYIQNLLLRVTFEGLSAVELGGLYDDDFKKILCLQNTDAIITLGVLCGQ